jgi:hypothetical protein
MYQVTCELRMIKLLQLTLTVNMTHLVFASQSLVVNFSMVVTIRKVTTVVSRWRNSTCR